MTGLSERAGHPESNLAALHGSLFTARCFDTDCTYTCPNSQIRPLIPCLNMPSWDVSDARVPLPSIAPEDLPHCPRCGSLLRPGVVWFGEKLPSDVLDRVNAWMESVERVDVMLVIGTAARVTPASEYITRAVDKGALVVELNVSADEELYEADFLWPGDVSFTLPQLVGTALEDKG